jgi:hypothetical protein
VEMMVTQMTSAAHQHWRAEGEAGGVNGGAKDHTATTD